MDTFTEPVLVVALANDTFTIVVPLFVLQISRIAV